MDNASTDTVVQNDNNAPVTDTATSVDNVEQSIPTTDTKSDITTPTVEMREGKTFVNGIRMYSRDDTNKIAANAKRDVENKLLQELDVDSFDKVKSVVKQLQTADSRRIQS